MPESSVESLKESLVHESKISIEFVVLMATLTSVMALSIDAILPAFKMIGDDCKYVMQFDNDCEVTTDNFLDKLVNVMDNNDKIGAIMMKRTGVSTQIKTYFIIFHSPIFLSNDLALLSILQGPRK